MASCWASQLGGCSGGPSREHYFSKSVFDAEIPVIVQGMPWQNGESQVLTVDNLTSKILCQRHNNELSPLDDAAGDLFRTIKNFDRVSKLRAKARRVKAKPIIYSLDGAILEKWFIKTMINLGVLYGHRVGRDAENSKSPDLSLVKIVFGKDNLKSNAGLYTQAELGGTLAVADELKYGPVLEQRENYAQGAQFSFKGVRFYLQLNPDSPPSNFIGMRHLKRIEEKSEKKRLIQAIDFVWPADISVGSKR